MQDCEVTTVESLRPSQLQHFRRGSYRCGILLSDVRSQVPTPIPSMKLTLGLGESDRRHGGEIQPVFLELPLHHQEGKAEDRRLLCLLQKGIQTNPEREPDININFLPSAFCLCWSQR